MNSSKIKILLILACTLMLSDIHGQLSKSWSTWTDLYRDQDISVELSIYTPKPNSCIDNNKTFKINYRVTGKYKVDKVYLNWKVAYYDCNGLRYYQQNSLPLWTDTYSDISGGNTIPASDINFTGKSIDKIFFDVEVSRTKKVGNGLLPPLRSKDPSGVKGSDNTFMGKVTELEVTGGALGEGAKWIWYIGECGGRQIGEGKKIEIRLPQTTTLFVRAEGKLNKTKCVRKRIVVNQGSSPPNYISGKDKVCKGDKVKLKVSGGSLGLGAQWVWYDRVCGGNKIGTGEFLNVRPRNNTQYFVRAEGDLNTTACVNLLVSVHSPVQPPAKINGSALVCKGESIQLSAPSANGSALKWYSGSCGGKYIGTGESIRVKPFQKTTYYLRAEGACNTSTCIAKTVKVSERSSLPSTIQVVESKKGKILRMGNNALLANGAKWKWYRNSCNKGPVIGTARSIKINESKIQRTYYVKAEGGCSNDICKSVIVKGVRNKISKFQNFNTLHYGLNFGLEYNNIEDIPTYSSSNIEELTGLGLRGEIVLHPILKDNLSLGLLSSASVGTSAYVFNGGDVTNKNYTDDYFYFHSSLGAEFTLGFSTMKILAKLTKYYQRNNLTRSINGSVANFDNDLYRESIGLGLRIGSYKNRNYTDVLFLLYRNNANNFLTFTNIFNDTKSSFTGFNFTWHRSDDFMVRSNFYFPITQKQLLNNGIEKISANASILISLDRFY